MGVCFGQGIGRGAWRMACGVVALWASLASWAPVGVAQVAPPEVVPARAVWVDNIPHRPSLMPGGKEPAYGRWDEVWEVIPISTWQGWLSNGVRVHTQLQITPRDRVLIHIALAGGGIEETAENRGVTGAAVSAFSNLQTRTRSGAELRELLRGSSIGARGFVAGDTTRLVIVCEAPDFERAMQLAHLLLTEPVVPESGVEQWRELSRTRAQNAMRSTRSAYDDVMMGLIFPEGDPRGRPLTLEQIDRVTTPMAQAWIDRLVRTAPMEVAVVGRVQRDRVIDVTQRYLGSLPARERVSAQTNLALRTLPALNLDREVDLSLPSPGHLRTYVSLSVHAPDEVQEEELRAMQLAADILTKRLRARAVEFGEAGEGASAAVTVSPGNIFPGYGIMQGLFAVRNQNAELAQRLLREEFEKLAREGVGAEELLASAQALRDRRAEDLRLPQTWANLLENATLSGRVLHELHDSPNFFERVPAAKVQEVMQRALARGALRVTLRSTGEAGGPGDAPRPTVR